MTPEHLRVGTSQNLHLIHTFIGQNVLGSQKAMLVSCSPFYHLPRLSEHPH